MGRVQKSLAFMLAAAGLALGGPAGAAQTCQLKSLGELPVNMAGLAPLVSAKIDGHDAKLEVDTGAFFSMLAPSSAASFGLKVGPLPPYLSVGGVGGEVRAGLATAKDFNVNGADIRNADFIVGEHRFGGAADGLLGSNFLTVADVEFDFQNGLIHFFEETHCEGASLAYWSQQGGYGALDISHIDTLPVRTAQPQLKIVGNATLNGVRIRVVFDSGANRSVLTLRAARRAGISIDSPGVERAGVSTGIGRQLITDYLAPFKSFDIGGEQVEATHLRIADIVLDDADMLLGADFFLSHRIFVSKSQSKVFFTYNGGKVFDLGPATPTPLSSASSAPPAPAPPSAAPTPDAADQPTDAAGFARRAAGFLARRQLDQAIADDSQAITLAPTEPDYYLARAEARLLNRQPLMALDDLNQAVKLKPDDARALFLRGGLKLAARDVAGAKSDFEGALKADPSLQMRIAADYERAGLLEEALSGVDAWIGGQRRSEDLAGPLAVRCRLRAYLNRDLSPALDDCSQSLKLVPGSPAALTARGLVELRLGQVDKSIKDFDAAVAIEPRNAWAIYGRGLAKQKAGDGDGGKADLAAATALQPNLPQQAKKVGLES